MKFDLYFFQFELNLTSSCIYTVDFHLAVHCFFSIAFPLLGACLSIAISADKQLLLFCVALFGDFVAFMPMKRIYEKTWKMDEQGTIC